MGTKYATHEVRKKIEGRLRDMKECKENPMAWQHITDKQQFLADEKKSLSALEDLTPPDTTGTEKDGIKRRLAMLNEALVNGNPRSDLPYALAPSMLGQFPGDSRENRNLESILENTHS